MRVRTITYFFQLEPSDFGSKTLEEKFVEAKRVLDKLSDELVASGYQVQTLRVSLNSFEDWLPRTSNETGEILTELVKATIGKVILQLERNEIHVCSVGGCVSDWAILLVPNILQQSSRLSCSVRFNRQNEEMSTGSSIFQSTVVPNYSSCLLAAEASLKVLSNCGSFGNFRFCASFNCRGGIPFFPASYNESGERGKVPSVTIGLENGDFLFLAFYGADSPDEGRANLYETMKQALLPLQRLLIKACERTGGGVVYGGPRRLRNQHGAGENADV